MRTIKLLIAFILFLSINVLSFGQEKFKVEADKYFEMKQYNDAIKSYKKAYYKTDNDKEKVNIKFQAAECCRLMKDYTDAEFRYRIILRSYDDPIKYLYYADALKANGKYDKALEMYNEYIKENPSDVRGKNGVKSIKLAQEWIKNAERYDVDNFKIVNSNKNDFATVYSDKKKYNSLIFTSSREETTGKTYNSNTGEKTSDLYYITRDRSNTWSKPLPIGEIINTETNEIGSCTNTKASILYITRWSINAKSKEYICNLYEVKKVGRSWGEPKLISISGTEGFYIGTPSLSNNELELYFSSDMEGGHGGNDIWVVKRSSKSKPFGEPKNLGASVNTSGDEEYPFIRKDNVLFFSSDGHIGMGGLDIFKAEKKGDTWGNAVNLKYPMNSNKDDFSITYEGIKDKGFLTSNRDGGIGGYDIYTFNLPQLRFSLEGIIKDSLTQQPLDSVVVELTNSKEESITFTTGEDGKYSFDGKQVLSEESYNISFSKSNYIEEKSKISTVGLKSNEYFLKDVVLLPDGE